MVSNQFSFFFFSFFFALGPLPPPSVIRGPLSIIHHLLSIIYCPSSVIRHPHPGSVVRHPSSVIHHPPSVVRRPSSATHGGFQLSGSDDFSSLTPVSPCAFRHRPWIQFATPLLLPQNSEPLFSESFNTTD